MITFLMNARSCQISLTLNFYKMKYLIITLCLVCYSITYSVAQSFENKKMLTTSIASFNYQAVTTTSTIDINPTIESRSTSFSINPQVTYGKVNSNNELIAYGIGVGISSTFNRNDQGTVSESFGFGVSPMMLIQKFIPLHGKFHYSPALIGTIGYHQKNFQSSQFQQELIERGVHSSISFIPLSVTYSLSNTSNLVLSLGVMAINFSIDASKSEIGQNTMERFDSRFSSLNNLTRFGLGYQMMF